MRAVLRWCSLPVVRCVAAVVTVTSVSALLLLGARSGGPIESIGPVAAPASAPPGTRSWSCADLVEAATGAGTASALPADLAAAMARWRAALAGEPPVADDGDEVARALQALLGAAEAPADDRTVSAARAAIDAAADGTAGPCGEAP